MILNGKVINPGDLRTSIKLKHKDVTQDSGGFPVKAYVDIDTVWARWTNAHGNELVADNAVQAEGLATVLIRYIAGLDTTVVVEKDSLNYEITSLDDIQERHEYIELRVRRMKAG